MMATRAPKSSLLLAASVVAAAAAAARAATTSSSGGASYADLYERFSPRLRGDVLCHISLRTLQAVYYLSLIHI